MLFCEEAGEVEAGLGCVGGWQEVVFGFVVEVAVEIGCFDYHGFSGGIGIQQRTRPYRKK